MKECERPDSSDIGENTGMPFHVAPAYMNTYSCQCSESQLMKLQSKAVAELKKKHPELYRSYYINLDFHSVPHYGAELEMEKVWCGSRDNTMKGANTVFIQDSKSNTILYTRAAILRNEEAKEAKRL